MNKLKFTLFLAIALFSFNAQSQVDFFQGSINEAKFKAQNDGKKVAVYFYADWARPALMMLNKTFTDTEVGNYFNRHFVTIKIDGSKGEGKLQMAGYGMDSYPSLIILEEDDLGRLQENGRIIGYKSPEQLIHFGKAFESE